MIAQLVFLLGNFWLGIANAQAPAGGPPRTTMNAESPFKNYGLDATIFTILGTILVVVLLIGGFLVVNLAFLSKRKEDRIGGRTPSDVAFLKTTNWPQEEDDARV